MASNTAELIPITSLRIVTMVIVNDQVLRITRDCSVIELSENIDMRMLTGAALDSVKYAILDALADKGYINAP